jgi:hypothetical protein
VLAHFLTANSSYTFFADQLTYVGISFNCRSYYSGASTSLSFAYSTSGIDTLSMGVQGFDPGGWFNAMTVQVRFQATDIGIGGSIITSTNTGTLETPSSINTATTTATILHSWSTGAKAGVGVGVFLGILLVLIGLGVLILWQKRRRQARREIVTDHVQKFSVEQHTVPEEKHLYPGYKAELEGEL